MPPEPPPSRDPLRPETPDLEDVVARARRVELAARRLLEGRLPGRHRSLFRGHGVELAEIRPYQPGDDFRSIDWNVTARAGRPHVKQVEEEREIPLLLAVDVSGSLDFGTARRTKRERAAEIAATLALASLREGHPVGQLLFTDRLEGQYVAPGRGRGRLRRLLSSLVAPTEGRGTDLSRGLDAARLLTRRRSLVVVVTDLVGAGDFGGALDGLSRRHDVLVVEVRDPADDRLPGGGLLAVRDPESGRSGHADLASPRVRRRLEERAAGERARAHAELERRGVDRVTVGTDSDFAEELAAVFRRRGSRAGRAGGRR